MQLRVDARLFETQRYNNKENPNPKIYNIILLFPFFIGVLVGILTLVFNSRATSCNTFSTVTTFTHAAILVIASFFLLVTFLAYDWYDCWDYLASRHAFICTGLVAAVVFAALSFATMYFHKTCGEYELSILSLLNGIWFVLYAFILLIVALYTPED
jgi:hypothetical protein